MEKPEETVVEKQPAPEDYAARDYQLLLPKFYEKIETLSNRQLKRVLTAMAEHPFERTTFRWSYPEEKEAFNIGIQLYDRKFIMMRAFLELKKEELAELNKEMTEPTPEVINEIVPS